MTLEKITPQALDSFMREWDDVDIPSQMPELQACAEIAEYSRSVGVIVRSVNANFPAGPLERSRLLDGFASLVAAGIRIGWHLRKQQEQVEKLEGLFSLDDLRREIQESA